MTAAWIHLAFTAALAAVFAAIVVRTYRASRRDRLEAPKYRMLRDDEDRADLKPEGGR